MKKSLLVFRVACTLFSFAGIQQALAQVTYYSRASGNWSDVTTWSQEGHAGSVASKVPGNVAGSSSSDVVIISAGHSVILDADREIGGLTVGSAVQAGVLTIGNDNVNRTLSVQGAVTVEANGILTRNTAVPAGIHRLKVTGDLGSITNNGKIVFSDLTRPAEGWSVVDLIMEIGGSVEMKGLAPAANSTLNSLTVNKNNRSIKLGSHWTVAEVLTIQAGYLELGDALVQYTLNGSTAAAYIRVDINGILRIYGTASFPSGYSATLDGDDGTIEYAGVNQAIAGPDVVTKFHNLIISGTGVKTLSAPTLCHDKVTIMPGATLATANHTLTLQGNFSNNGTFLPGTGLVRFSGNISQAISGTASFYSIEVSKQGVGTGVFVTSPLAVSSTTSLAEGVLDLGTVTGHALGTVTGTGTMALSAPAGGTTTFPSGNFAAFLTSSGNGAVEYNGTVSYTLGTPPLPYAYLKVSGTGTKSVTALTQVAKDLMIASGATLNLGSAQLALTGNFINDGTLSGTGTINFNNTTALQTIGGSTQTTFQNLTVSKASGINLVLTTAARVNGVLALANPGNVELGVYNLTIGPSGSITGNAGGTGVAAFASNRMILQDGTNSANGALVQEGNSAAALARLFPIGTGMIYSYAQITQLNATVTAPGSVSVKAIPFSTPHNNIVRRYWRVKASNVTTITNAQVTFKYDPSEITVSGTPTFVVKRFANNVENDVVNSFTDNATQTFGVKTTGNIFLELEWRMGDPTNFAKTYYSYQSGSWDVPNNWTTDPTGTILQGQPGAGGPTNGDRVIILNGRTMVMASANKTLTSLEIESGASLDIQTFGGHNFGTIRGAGLLRIATTSVPTGNYLEFVSPVGGTIEYYNYTGGLATNIPYYNNVIMSGTGTKIIGGPTRSIIVNGDFTVTGGTAVIGFGAGNKLTVNIYGDVTVGSGASVTIGNDQIHELNFYGNLVNNGSIDITNAAQYADASLLGAANLTMKGSANSSISGSGSKLELYRLIIDKGVDQTYILDVNPTNLTLGAPTNLPNGSITAPYSQENPEIFKALWIKNGTLKLGSNVNIPRLSNGGNDFFIPENGAIWLNGATVASFDSPTGSPGQCALTLYGKLRVTSGTWNGNGSAGIVYRTISEIIIEGGLVQVSQLRASTGGTGPANNRSAYVQTGGEFIVTGTGENNTAAAQFSLDKTSSIFRMSGGILRVRNATTTGAIDVRADAANYTVTGGLVEVTTNSNNAHSIRSTVPFYNFTQLKGAGTGNVSLSNNALVVLNDFTIGVNSVFNANNLNLSVNRHYTCQGTYTPGTNTTVFNGSMGHQTVSCPSGHVFNNVTISNSFAGGVVTFSGNGATTLNGNLDLIAGTLNDGGEVITVKGNVSNAAVHTGVGRIRLNNAVTAVAVISGDGNGMFRNLELNDAEGAALAGATTVTGTFTLTAGILDLKQYGMVFTETGSIAVSSPSATKMIKTAGNRSDGGITKLFSAPGAFTYPLGVTGKYTPVTITLSSASVFGGISINPVNARQPFVTSANSLAYYWEVKNTGFTGAKVLSYSFVYAAGDVSTGPESSYIGGYYNLNTPSSWTVSGAVNASTHTVSFNSVNYIAGEYTAGIPAAFNAVLVFYSRANGNWEVTSTWSNTGYGGAAASATPGAGNPVFIGDGITYNHTVTVTTNSKSSGTLRLASGSVLDVGVTTGHNFGAAVGEKVKGNGRLRISSASATAQFPAGDFGEFIAAGGGAVEYYRLTTDFKLPTVSASPSSLPLNAYNDLVVSPASGLITFPDINLVVYHDLTISAITGAGKALVSNTASGAGSLDVQHNLIVSGMLQYQNGQTRSIEVENLLQIDAGGSFGVAASGAVVTNLLGLNGSMINNGTFDMNNSTRVCDVTFTGTTNTTLTGAGSVTDFNRLVVDKGLGQTSLLEVNLSNFTLSAATTSATKALDLQDGTLKLSSAQTLVISSGTNGSDYLIPYSAQLWLNGGNLRITTTGTGAGLLLGGKLRVDAGTFYIEGGGTNDNYIEIAGGGNPMIEINGGELRVGSQIRRANTSTISALGYTQNAGSVILGTQSAPNTNRALLEVLNNGSSFYMTGGTLTLARQQTGIPTIAALYLQPSVSSVTGGTIQLGSAAFTPVGQNIQLYSSIPLYDVVIHGTNAPVVTLTVGDLKVKNTLTIGTSSRFDANDFDVYLQGDITVNGTYVPGNNTTYFNSTSRDQLLTGTTSPVSFNHLTIENSKTAGMVSFGVDAVVQGVLSIGHGILNDNARTVRVKGRVNNLSEHRSGGAGTGKLIFDGAAQQILSGNGQGALGNVEFNNAQGVQLDNRHTINGTITFTNGVFDIRSNQLVLGVSASISGSPRVLSMIQTNGTLSDQGIVKNFNASTFDFTFPVGTPAKYTPVRFAATANTASGNIVLKPVNRQHPSVTVGYDALNYYWNVTSSGFSGIVLRHFYTYGNEDINGNETMYVAARFTNDWTKGTSVGNVTAITNLITVDGSAPGVNFIAGDYTAGDPLAFQPVSTYISAQSGNWDVGSTWVGGVVPGDGAPVVINNNHAVTVSTAFAASPNSKRTFSLEIRTGARLILNNDTYGHNFGNVAGAGSLSLSSGIFPGGAFDQFVNAGGGTVEYSGSGYTLSTQLLYNNLVIQSGGTIMSPNADITLRGDFLLSAGVLDNRTANKKISIQGNWINNAGSAAYMGGNGTVEFAGSVAQTLGGSSVTQFSNLSINKPSGAVNCARDVVVTSGLRFTRGNIITNSFKVSAAPGVSVNHTNGHAVGNYAQVVGTTPVTYPVGTTASYLPVTISLSAGATEILASVAGVNPVTAMGPGEATNPLMALFSIEPVLFPVGATATATFQYPDNVRQPGFTQSQAFAARWDGATSAWQSFRLSSTPSPNEDPSSVTVTGIGQFSKWAIFSGINNSPLPIVLKRFSAVHFGDRVELEWVTASESNTSSFGVEKTLDGKKFVGVGEVAAAGHSVVEQRYNLMDEHPDAGLSYYRLYEIDLDDTKTYFDIVAVEFRHDPFLNFFVIHPNPTTGLLYIRSKFPASRLQVTVCDLAGRALVTKRWKDVGLLDTLEMDIRDLKAGLYLLLVSPDDESMMRTYKFSKY